MYNFEGWLIKFGEVILPNSFMVSSGWKSNPNQRIELDAYRDSSPQVLLHRETAEGTKTKLELTIRSLNLEERTAFDNVLGVATLGFTEKKERKVAVTYWNDDFGILNYVSGNFYMKDPEFTIINIDEETKDIEYGEFKLTLTEY